MEELYSKPARVYIVLFLLALVGVWAGLNLPISLFPNSSQPNVYVRVPYGEYSSNEFFTSFGKQLEGQLKAIIVDKASVKELSAEYRDKDVRYVLTFEWGTNGDKALQQVQTVMSSASSSWTEEIRTGYSVDSWNENAGFIAISFFSNKRTLNELYLLLNPLLGPHLSSVTDAEWVGLDNPERQRIVVVLDLEKMASLRVIPSDVEYSILKGNRSLSGGRIKMGEDQWQIEMPRWINDVKTLQNLTVYTRAGNAVRLNDLAIVKIENDKNSSRSFRTNGEQSVILEGEPKPGANIKRMSDQVIQIVDRISPQLPEDVKFKVLVNPSEFIASSIKNVAKEVLLSAALAVVILFLFIGSLKNVATAAIEIPLSIILAFILMKLTGVNLNLISLGGLALSAGMNVDASVVVMENIFRHFEGFSSDFQKKFDGNSFSESKLARLRESEMLKTLVRAVKEVQGPILASTITSVVVFLPLLMTKGLTSSILGDLSRAVVYSHSMSAIVALILVPTIRFQLVKGESHFLLISPIDNFFKKLERFYFNSLKVFLERKRFQRGLLAFILLALVAQVGFILPKLPKEIVGKPDTDWMILAVNPQQSIPQKELIEVVEKTEYEALQKYQQFVQYSFTQINTNNGVIMLRLQNKRDMDLVWKKMEEDFVNTPTLSFYVMAWNPSELRIPDPPDLKWEIQGSTAEKRKQAAFDLVQLLNEQKSFQRTWAHPNVSNDKTVILNPQESLLLDRLNTPGAISLGEISQFVRVATTGKRITSLKDESKQIPIDLEVPTDRFSSLVDLRGLPLSIEKKIVSLSSMVDIQVKNKPPVVYRIDQNDINYVYAKVAKAQKGSTLGFVETATKALEKWKLDLFKPTDVTNTKTQHEDDLTLSVTSGETQKELNEAIDQLKVAIVISIVLIFLTLMVQFGEIGTALVVMLPIPFGFIGVVFSLFVFKSTLSLNSVLGLILLNGIAVANSIILVDFIKRKFDSGMSPKDAAIEASQVRLRPILMTSLTTILGMLPIALGLGDGGKILQPLGISVSGGLWISLLLTLYFVPFAYVLYLNAFGVREQSTSIPEPTTAV